MIRAVYKNGKIQPVDEIPKHWQNGDLLVVRASIRSDDKEAPSEPTQTESEHAREDE